MVLNTSILVHHEVMVVSGYHGILGIPWRTGIWISPKAIPALAARSP